MRSCPPPDDTEVKPQKVKWRLAWCRKQGLHKPGSLTHPEIPTATAQSRFPLGSGAPGRQHPPHSGQGSLPFPERMGFVSSFLTKPGHGGWAASCSRGCRRDQAAPPAARFIVAWHHLGWRAPHRCHVDGQAEGPDPHPSPYGGNDASGALSFQEKARGVGSGCQS